MEKEQMQRATSGQHQSDIGELGHVNYGGYCGTDPPTLPHHREQNLSMLLYYIDDNVKYRYEGHALAPCVNVLDGIQRPKWL
jgi:hypothetical protein